MKKQKRWFRLPDGRGTTNSNEYADEWRKLAEPIEKATGAIAFGYDPGVSFSFEGGAVQLPTNFIFKLNAALKVNPE